MHARLAVQHALIGYSGEIGRRLHWPMGRNQTPELWTPRIRNDDDDEGDDVDDVDRQNKVIT